jgi:hypothetical protein
MTDPTIAATREEALNKGISKYQSGKSCSKGGHDGVRYTLTMNCVECTKGRVALKRTRDRDRYRAAQAANTEAATQGGQG